MTTDAEGFSHRFITANGVKLHCAECGSEDGKLVVLLHGFPEFWWTWRHQMRALAEHGYRVVAPDMRGYNLSERPTDVASYRLEVLADDVAALIRAYGREEAIIVGHDWGAIVAWEFAMHHQAMLERLAILNVPHPVQLAAGLRTLRQLKKSWYMFAFQLPWLPEGLIGLDNFAIVRRSFGRSVSGDDLAPYLEAARKGGNLAGGINYYRALIRGLVTKSLRPPRRIDKPVLVIWGDRDRYIGKELADPPSDLVPNCTVHHIAAASHWVQEDAAGEVSDQLAGFAGAQP
jgi:pimeloyl-ACP methyl ester carboxylesterase